MAPVKMQDGQWAYPIESLADIKAARAAGCERFEFTACGNDYNLPGDEVEGSRGWIFEGNPEMWLSGPGPQLSDRRRVRGVQGVLHRVPKPTLWQRIKGWFA